MNTKIVTQSLELTLALARKEQANPAVIALLEVAIRDSRAGEHEKLLSLMAKLARSALDYHARDLGESVKDKLCHMLDLLEPYEEEIDSKEL